MERTKRVGVGYTFDSILSKVFVVWPKQRIKSEGKKAGSFVILRQTIPSLGSTRRQSKGFSKNENARKWRLSLELFIETTGFNVLLRNAVKIRKDGVKVRKTT